MYGFNGSFFSLFASSLWLTESKANRFLNFWFFYPFFFSAIYPFLIVFSQIVGMREILSNQVSNDQDPNQMLSVRLCEQLGMATVKEKDVFKEAMYKASALLIIRAGK